MTCKEFEKLIPDFIGKKLDFLTLKKFTEHMEQCGECKEELVIQFLVTEGMQRLEDGDAFDLQYELDLRLEEAKSQAKLHSIFLYLRAGLETVAVLLIAGAILWFIL